MKRRNRDGKIVRVSYEYPKRSPNYDMTKKKATQIRRRPDDDDGSDDERELPPLPPS